MSQAMYAFDAPMNVQGDLWCYVIRTPGGTCTCYKRGRQSDIVEAARRTVQRLEKEYGRGCKTSFMRALQKNRYL